MLQLNNVKSGYSTGIINSNFQAIEDYINNYVLNRDGVVPGEANQMNIPLDMNSKNILNIGRMDAKEIGLNGIPIKELLDNIVEESTQEADRAKQEADRAKQEADRAEAGEIAPDKVKQLYESNPDTNAFTDADVITLAGIQPQIDDINLLIGDIGAVLDAINGEVV